MEYVKVTFTGTNGTAIDRGVIIDDQASGQTDQTLMVERAHHEFTLAAPYDFTPSVQTLNVVNTSSGDPMIIAFTQLTT